MYTYSLLAVAVLSAICTVYLIHNASKGINPLYILASFVITVTNVGYYFFDAADNLQSSLFANAIAYIGGIFLPLILVFIISDFTGNKTTAWLNIILFILNAGVYVTILLSYKYRFYYSYSYFDAMSHMKLNNEPGIGYYVRLGVLFVEVALCVFFVINVLVKKKTVSRKTMSAFVMYFLITLFAYAASSLFKINHSVVSFSYLLCEIALVATARQFQLYDVTSNVQKNLSEKEKRGYFTLDSRFNLAACNKAAISLFPDLGDTRVDTAIITNSFTLNEILRWVKKLSASIKPNSLYSKDFIINESNLEYNIHIKCVLTPITFGFKKVIMGYLIEVIDETEQINYINELSYTGVRLKQEAERQTKRAENLQGSVILGMASMIESRDNSTGGHINRTSATVQLFVDAIKASGKFNRPETYWSNVINAAPLHDLGKIAVDDRILRKTSALSDEEYKEMQRHAAVGAEIVQQVLADVDDKEFVRIASNVAHYHHEKYDGSGYPDGLRGRMIPFEARIMALADVFDALMSKRYYKEQMSYDQAFDIIKEGLGKHFDPDLGLIFLQMRDDLIILYDSFSGVDDPGRLK